MSGLLTQNLPLLARAPNGIKKLRELILELAVRGKLVPQDPSDEPASELLKRIAAEKARLVGEGKLKKSKDVEEIAAEVLYPIPATWTGAFLGEVVEVVRGITFPASEKSKTPAPGRVACLRTSNVQSEIEWGDLLFIRESFVSRPDQFVQPHDIVMSMANSRELVGKVALIDAELEQKTTFGGFLGVLRPILIEPRFVMALLRTPTARSVLIDSASQTTNIANISLAKLRPLPFAIPPLAEQHRIVDKVDELMALCDRLEAEQADVESAHSQLVTALLGSLTQASDANDFAANWQRLSAHFHTLFTTASSVDALRQTLLQLAVMGKLVPQDPSDEPASVLLDGIAGVGVHEGQKMAAETEKETMPFELPAGWEWSRLSDLKPDFQNGASSRGDSEGVPVTVLRLADIKAGEICFEDTRALTLSPVTASKYALEVGDVLIIRVNGSADLVGRFVVCRIASQVIPCDHFIRMRFPENVIEPAYLKLVGDTEKTRAAIAGLFVSTAGQKTVNQGHVGSLLVPLPPLTEQHRIVAKVDQLMTFCDQFKSRLIQARQLNEQLASALVERAVA